MEIVEIPFTKHIGLKQENETLKLEPLATVKNHIDTIHASAQFALAETQSGLFLELAFPEYKGSCSFTS